ncbi:ABC transporter G family member 15 [Durusdinium trenchii]|uniref:ABC transporter G family member 15 n=1 Tax=Durusdinium trenchii TaxID=1381693 RepID=A0ABP0MCF6_9DINO
MAWEDENLDRNGLPCMKEWGDQSIGQQVNSLRPSSARYSFARARNRSLWAQENTPGPGAYDLKDYAAALTCASKSMGSRPQSAKTPRRTPRDERDEYRQEGLSYPTEAWECTTAATPRKYMVFGTESREAQVFDMDLMKECAHVRYGHAGPGLIYDPDDRMGVWRTGEFSGYLTLARYGGYGGSMYGGGGYGGSMYGGGYGGYGGFGSMYGGGSMYGRGGMYGSGYGGQPGMYGNREQESQFFVPKMPEQPQDPANNRMEEIRETNSWFLDSVYSYGDRVYQFGRRLLDGLAKLQTAVSKGKVPPAVYRRAFTFAVTFGSVLFAALAHRLVRRHKQLAWDAYRRPVGR